MEMYRICPKSKKIHGGFDKRMEDLNVAVPHKMWLYHTKEHIKTSKMAIIKGIFQGDCLFCLAWIPLTNMLKRQGAGYVVKEINKVKHLFYMDYLKLLYRYETEL